MIEVLIQSSTYIVIIFIAYIFKRQGIFKSEDSKILSKISVNLTLPAAIIYSFQDFSLKREFLTIVVFGFIINILMVIPTLYLSRNAKKEDRVLLAFNNSSFNIGSFALPYIQAFYAPAVVIYVLMFDIGNAIYSMGVNNAIVTSFITKEKNKKFEVKKFITTMFKSKPFATYVLMICLSLFNIALPTPIYTMGETIGKANIIIVMFMFGLMFEIPKKKYSIVKASKILTVRYATVIGIAIAFWIVAPLEKAVLQVLIISFLAPMSSIIPTFCMEHEADVNVYGLTSSISVLISILLLTMTLIVFI